MKKLWIILVTLGISGGTSAQQSILQISDHFAVQDHSTYSDQPPYRSNQPRSKEKQELVQVYDSIYYWIWDLESMKWMILYKIVDMIYDTNHNLTSKIFQSSQDTSRNLYTYDANNKLTRDLRQIIHNNIWINNLLLTYTYDGNSNKTRFLFEKWDGESWENNSQVFYTYDINSRLVNEIKQIWVDTVGWQNYVQMFYTYDQNNNLASELRKSWMDFEWANSVLVTKTYDDHNNLLSYLHQTWNDDTWLNNKFYKYTYNEHHSLISVLHLSWVDNSWDNSAYDTIIYHTEDLSVHKHLYSWDGVAWVYAVLRVERYDANHFLVSDSYKYWDDDGELAEGDSTHYYYHTVLGIHDLADPHASISLYPHPASSAIHIEIPVNLITKHTYLQIYNISGQLLLQQQVTEPKTLLDVSRLKSGIYLMKVVNERTATVIKFVKH